MSSPHLLAAIAAIALGSTGTVLAQGCATEKLATPNFQEVFQGHHYDLVVLLDVDKEYEQLLHDSGVADTRSEGEREQYLHELARNLTVAKERRLAGTKFRIDSNLELGPEVVVRVADWADVCDLARNPHVVTIWLNLPTRPT